MIIKKVVTFYKQKDLLEQRVEAAEEAILNADTLEEDETLETKLEGDRKKLDEVKQKIVNAEQTLGAAGMKMLQGLLKSPYIKKRMNALAVKTRIRHKMCQRKFKFDRFERAARRQRNGMSYSVIHIDLLIKLSDQKLHAHVESAVKY